MISLLIIPRNRIDLFKVVFDPKHMFHATPPIQTNSYFCWILGSYPGILIHNQEQESLYNRETDSIINSSNVGTWNNHGSPRSAIEKHKEYSKLIKPDLVTLKHGIPSSEINMWKESSSKMNDEGVIDTNHEEKGLRERIIQHDMTDTYRGGHSSAPKARSVCHCALKKHYNVTIS